MQEVRTSVEPLPFVKVIFHSAEDQQKDATNSDKESNILKFNQNASKFKFSCTLFFFGLRLNALNHFEDLSS